MRAGRTFRPAFPPGIFFRRRRSTHLRSSAARGRSMNASALFPHPRANATTAPVQTRQSAHVHARTRRYRTRATSSGGHAPTFCKAATPRRTPPTPFRTAATMRRDPAASFRTAATWRCKPPAPGCAAAIEHEWSADAERRPPPSCNHPPESQNVPSIHDDFIGGLPAEASFASSAARRAFDAAGCTK